MMVSFSTLQRISGAQWVAGALGLAAVGGGAYWVWRASRPPRTLTKEKEPLVNEIDRLAKAVEKLRANLKPYARDPWGPDFLRAHPTLANAAIASVDDLLQGLEATKDEILRGDNNPSTIQAHQENIDETWKILSGAFSKPDLSSSSEEGGIGDVLGKAVFTPLSNLLIPLGLIGGGVVVMMSVTKKDGQLNELTEGDAKAWRPAVYGAGVLTAVVGGFMSVKAFESRGVPPFVTVLGLLFGGYLLARRKKAAKPEAPAKAKPVSGFFGIPATLSDPYFGA